MQLSRLIRIIFFGRKSQLIHLIHLISFTGKCLLASGPNNKKNLFVNTGASIYGCSHRSIDAGASICKCGHLFIDATASIYRCGNLFIDAGASIYRCGPSIHRCWCIYLYMQVHLFIDAGASIYRCI